MVVGAKVCELTDDFLWFVCGLYVGILTSPLSMAKTSASCVKTIPKPDVPPFGMTIMFSDPLLLWVKSD